MGATTNTLADYLISIRTKSKDKHRRRSSSFTKQASLGKGFKKRRSLVQEIWSAEHNNKNTKHPYSTIDTNQAKRMRISPGVIRDTHESIVSAEMMDFGQGGDGFQNYKQSACTLQPQFTKEEDHGANHPPVQFQFEFSRNILDEISLMDMHSGAAVASSDFSIISQITLDSSLLEPIKEEEEECYSYSSESDSSEVEYMSSDDESSSQSSVTTRTRYNHRDVARPPSEVKTAELKEGAQLLLDLFSM